VRLTLISLDSAAFQFVVNSVNMEVYVFLFRSIRRRIVTGFSGALALSLIIAGVAVWGLLQHQTAVTRLNTVVHESPDRAKLLTLVYTIPIPLYARVDLEQDVAILSVRTEYVARVKAAQAELLVFWKRCEEAAREPMIRGVGQGRHPVLQVTMQAVKTDLETLAALTREIDFFPSTPKFVRESVVQNTGWKANVIVADIGSKLDRLPSFEKERFVAASLLTEEKRSRAALSNVWMLIAGALAFYAIAIYLAFQWISNPLRAITRGASRIANGDTDYRLGNISRWDDEFEELTSDFNRMADRFQESEEHLNAKVEERSRQLVRSERLAGVGFLAAGVAHEINNPLSSISMAAESLQYRLVDHLDPDHEDTKEAISRLEMIQRESKRCGQITRRLLDFSRNERQDKVPNDLTRVIGEVLAMIRPMSKYDDRKIMFDRVDPLMLEINASQIKQVVLNLVANGLQATDSGGTVSVRLEEQTDWVVIEVADDGHGMKPENIEHLFEPFFSTKETGEGTGLGLSITHRIVVEHHGTIDPSSAGEGKGSKFIVRLPRRQPLQKAA